LAKSALPLSAKLPSNLKHAVRRADASNLRDEPPPPAWPVLDYSLISVRSKSLKRIYWRRPAALGMTALCTTPWLAKTGLCKQPTDLAAKHKIPSKEPRMHLSNESLIVIIIVGIVAGWLAGNIVRGGGYGLIGDLIVGIIGAFIGDRLLPQVGIHLGTGMVALVVNATLGAIVLLIILRLISGAGGGGWGSRFGRRW
jgi:uncharacterized membrane protein YeaQ/YmgE (transglycosylase-associated protein family)